MNLRDFIFFECQHITFFAKGGIVVTVNLRLHCIRQVVVMMVVAVQRTDAAVLPGNKPTKVMWSGDVNVYTHTQKSPEEGTNKQNKQK